jgi:hypothetical protein
MLDIDLPRILVALVTAAIVLGALLLARQLLSRRLARLHAPFHDTAEEHLAGEALAEADYLSRRALSEAGALERGAIGSVDRSEDGSFPASPLSSPDEQTATPGVEALKQLLVLIPEAQQDTARAHADVLRRVLDQAATNMRSYSDLPTRRRGLPAISATPPRQAFQEASMGVPLTRVDLVSALATERELARSMDMEREKLRRADARRDWWKGFFINVGLTIFSLAVGWILSAFVHLP